MKRFGCIGMLVLLLMAACHTPTREGRQMMAQAKALSDTAPDSAVKLIDSILRKENRFSERQRMDLALLQGELVFRDASIDEEVLPEGVSTSPELERASAYFAKRKEYTKAAHASLYSGYVQQAYGERENAMRSYKEAEHYGGLANDSLTMACAYYKMAKYLLNDGMKGEALVTLEKADKVLPSQHGDKALVQNMMAVCYMLQDDLDHSEECLRRGMSYAEHTEANRAKRKIWNNYSVFYCLKGDFPQAVNSLREVAKDTCLDETEELLYYLNMGKIFMMENASDSAALYFEKLAQLPLLSTIKPESRLAANDALLKYAKEKKNDTLVSFYQKKYEENLFEIMSQRQEQSIFRIQQQYDYEAEKNILNRKIIHRQRVITIISVLLFISSLVILAFQYRNKKLLKEEEEMKRQIDRMKQDLRQSVKPTVLADEVDMRLQIIISAFQTMKHSNDPKREWRPLVNKIMNGKENAFEAARAAIEMAYPGLYATIIAQHSDLNETEAKICLLSCSSLSNAEIAELLGLKLNTVNQGRSTLRKKLNLRPERLKEQLHYKLFSKKGEA